MRRPRRGPRIARERLTSFRRGLLAWYRRDGRDLPWRRTRDPYAVLVAEVMLQQTQVRRVLEFYPRFLARYPTIEDLAAAPADAVRDVWQGLGYYRRVRNLQRAARLVAERHGGRLPADPDELRRLPGIGRYTAGAVASFAYEREAPILDTNAARVLTRVFGAGRRAGRTARLWALAAAVLPAGRAYDFNQGIMDLGALVCTARRPQCPRCPVRRACATWRRSTAAATTGRRADRPPAQR